MMEKQNMSTRNTMEDPGYAGTIDPALKKAAGMALGGKLRSPPQPVYAFAEDSSPGLTLQQLPTQPLHPFSDGNVSDMGYGTSDLEGGKSRGRYRSRRGLKFF